MTLEQNLTAAFQAVGADMKTKANAAALNASALTTGTVPVARLGTSGTRSSGTVLYGDGTWKTAPPAGTDVTVTQNSNGTWPAITRGAGHYRWFAAYNADLRPTAANGAAPGDELVTPSGTVSLA